jgi:hypothetical protein
MSSNLGSHRVLRSPAFAVFLIFNMLSALALSACTFDQPGTPTKPDNAVVVSFAYSSEKKPW